MGAGIVESDPIEAGMIPQISNVGSPDGELMCYIVWARAPSCEVPLRNATEHAVAKIQEYTQVDGPDTGRGREGGRGRGRLAAGAMRLSRL